MNIVQAKDIIVMLRVDTTDIAVACASNLSFRYKNEIIGKTDVNAGLFRKKRVRISDFSASIQGLIGLNNDADKIANFYLLQEAIRRSNLYLTFVFTDEAGNVRSIAANYLVEEHDLNGGAEKDFGDFDVTLQGNGDLTLDSVIPAPPDPTCVEEDPIYIDLPDGVAYVESALLKPGAGQTITILRVSRSGMTYSEVTGSPTGLQFTYTVVGANGRITFETPGNPAAPYLEPVGIEYKIET